MVPARWRKSVQTCIRLPQGRTSGLKTLELDSKHLAALQDTAETMLSSAPKQLALGTPDEAQGGPT